MTATEKLLALDNTKSVVPVGPGTNDKQFSHADLGAINNPTGISIEEGELLYGLVRTTKPHSILETGTNIGVSASYMALALKENGFGHLTTIEHSRHVAEIAQNKFHTMGLDELITVANMGTGEFFAALSPNEMFDFLWLDTELKERYQELLTLWPHVKPGGIICIHDLWCLEFDWFGGVPEGMKALIRSGELRGLTFQTTHGVTVFQKRRTVDHFSDLVKSNI